MANNTTPPALLNPFTPLAFLTPENANQFEVSRYIAAVTLGIYIWDCAINLGSDYQLLFKHRIYYPTVIYYLSRISTMGYAVTSFVFEVGNVSDCQALMVALGVSFVLSTGFTALLFLFRVIAVWNMDRGIIASFTFLWLCTVGAAITVPFAIAGGHIGPTQACIQIRVDEYAEATAITSMINDSAIFIAITYRILVNSIFEENPSAHFHAFIGNSRSFLPKFPRNLLRSGQHYYLVALSGNVLLLVMMKAPNLPLSYRAMCTTPVLAVTNSMACIVYRQIKFGLISVDGSIDLQSFGSFKAASKQITTNTSIPMHIESGDQAASRPSVILNGSGSRSIVSAKLQINIKENQELHYDTNPDYSGVV
ncbi:hypothetical protein L218DRAFT_879724 [Marasmius fiardii PR-910]|nr:hypothetical protein L218DRAFT_879724 [Marasmius fiardii PR-910]